MKVIISNLHKGWECCIIYSKTIMGLFKFNTNRVGILDVATFFLNKEAMSQKKLQKLCYYAEAWSQALRNKSIAHNSYFEAWVHGPVNPILRGKYKDFGWKDIPKSEISDILNDAEDGVVGLLESVWLTYGDKDGDSLEILTHQERPWIEARAGLGEFEPSHSIISTETMRDFYLSIYQK